MTATTLGEQLVEAGMAQPATLVIDQGTIYNIRSIAGGTMVVVDTATREQNGEIHSVENAAIILEGPNARELGHAILSAVER